MVKLVLTLTFLMIFYPHQNAYAYLDMGTGSYIIQVIIGSFLGVAVTLKIFWSRIVNYFSNKRKAK